MKKIYQDKFGEPKGNCLQAAIASIFELALDAVPNFVEFEDDWFVKLTAFVKRWDVTPCYIPLHGDDVKEEEWKPAGWHLIEGKSPRGDYNHVIVGHNGGLAHDPFPNGNCELDSHEFWVVFISRIGKMTRELGERGEYNK
jgi:hypothetical protein